MEARNLVLSTADGGRLAVTHWPADGPTVVLLHAGVADSRSWTTVAEALVGRGLDVVAYDRRGFGASPAAEDGTAFTHLADLIEVCDGLALDQVFLVGNSMGGALALDAALVHPGRVARVLLIGAAVSGMTDEDTPFDWQPDPASAPLIDRADDESLSVDVRIRALAHLWLDGPETAEGRIGGTKRMLFESMNRNILEVAAPDCAGDAGIDAWTRLAELTVPVLSTWGEFDVPCDVPFYEETARRIDQLPGRVLPGVAHLPGLEEPELVAQLISDETPSVTLASVDGELLDRLTVVAASDAAAAEVTPPITPGNTWTRERLEWFEDYHGTRRAGLSGPEGEATWAIMNAGQPVGAVRLKRTAVDGVLETGIWLARSTRGRGVAEAAMRRVMAEARKAGAHGVRADTASTNTAAQRLMLAVGFTLDPADAEGRVHGLVRLD